MLIAMLYWNADAIPICTAMTSLEPASFIKPLLHNIYLMLCISSGSSRQNPSFSHKASIFSQLFSFLFYKDHMEKMRLM